MLSVKDKYSVKILENPYRFWRFQPSAIAKVIDSLQAYLSAIIVYLYAHDFKQAEKCYNDCCQ